jgi:hypothetical protein
MKTVKRLFYAPSLLLIALIGVICSMLDLERAEDWCERHWVEIWKECR